MKDSDTPPSIIGRALLALALFVSFYVLSIGIAPGLVYVAWGSV